MAIKCRLFCLTVKLMQKLKCCTLLILLCGFVQLSYTPLVQAEGLPEHRLKAAFLYNFAIYTQWPDDIINRFNLCIYGEHSFGNELDQLQEKKINQHYITVKYTHQINDLVDCHMVFISASSIVDMNDILVYLKDRPTLTIADSTSPKGAALSFILEDNKVKFDVNLVVAKTSGLNFSSQLLRFARKVHQ